MYYCRLFLIICEFGGEKNPKKTTTQNESNHKDKQTPNKTTLIVRNKKPLVLI
jgi:hypothetical protein